MKVTKEKVENSQAFLTVELDSAEVGESMEEAYRRLAKSTRVPGFRKGKVPRAVLESYLGKGTILEDALNELVPKAYEQAIKEQEIKAFAQGRVEVTQFDPVIFKATVPLPPTVTLGDYRNIRLTPMTLEVTEEMVDSVMEQLLHQHATWEPVARPVALKDLVNFDIESTVEGESFISQKEASFQVVGDSIFPLPGFAEQLVGMKQGETKEFKIKFPSDYAQSELADKEAEFKVVLHEIKQEILPEPTDELAKEIDPNCDNFDSLRENVTTSLKHQADERARAEFETQVVEEVVKISQAEFPPIMVDVEIDRMIQEQVKQWEKEGTNLEGYLKSVNKNEGELRDELKPVAARQVTWSLVVDKVTEEEKIEVSDAEIDAEIETVLKGVPENNEKLKEALNTPRSRDSLRQMLLTRQTIQRLVDIANTPVVTEEKAATEKAAAAEEAAVAQKTKKEKKDKKDKTKEEG